MEPKHLEYRLIQDCIKGKRKAQYELFSKYKVYLFGVCIRYSKTREEAEDMLQEAFYRILKDLKQYNNKGVLQAWMRRVTVNSALMFIRKHRKLKIIDNSDTVLEANEKVDLSLMHDINAQAIISLIRQLPDMQQTVFNLRAMEDFAFKEIADQLQLNEATIRSHYLRARQKLQSLLKQEQY